MPGFFNSKRIKLKNIKDNFWIIKTSNFCLKILPVDWLNSGDSESFRHENFSEFRSFHDPLLRWTSMNFLISNFDFVHYNQSLIINFFQVSLRLQTELWDVEKNSSIVTTPSLWNQDYAYGGSFLLSANECRQSGELSLFELNRPFKLKKSNLILMILCDNYFTYGLKRQSSSKWIKMSIISTIFPNIVAIFCQNWLEFWACNFNQNLRFLEPDS